MNLRDFLDEYENLSKSRIEQGWRALLERLARDPVQYEDLLLSLLDESVLLEQDDYFGTEGLDV